MIGFKAHLEEGPNDPAIFKAIFLAGGPGSGKTFITGRTALHTLGFKNVNSDTAYEKAMTAAGLEMDGETIMSAQGQAIRSKAKNLTQRQMDRYVKGRLGLTIDGTGRDYTKIAKLVTDARSAGYDVAMMYVNTDLETALARNSSRARQLPDDKVEEMWKEVQNNIGKFQRLFKENFIVIDNSDKMDYNKSTMEGFKWATKFAKKKITNPKAKKWIKAAQADKAGYSSTRSSVRSEAADLATNAADGLDFLLKDLKDKLMKEIKRNNFKNSQKVADMIQKTIEKDFKHKGYVRVKDK